MQSARVMAGSSVMRPALCTAAQIDGRMVGSWVRWYRGCRSVLRIGPPDPPRSQREPASSYRLPPRKGGRATPSRPPPLASVAELGDERVQVGATQPTPAAGRLVAPALADAGAERPRLGLLAGPGIGGDAGRHDARLGLGGDP